VCERERERAYQLFVVGGSQGNSEYAHRKRTQQIGDRVEVGELAEEDIEHDEYQFEVNHQQDKERFFSEVQVVVQVSGTHTHIHTRKTAHSAHIEEIKTRQKESLLPERTRVDS